MIRKETTPRKIISIASECKKCGSCCKHGSGFILPEEIKKIASHLNISEEKLKSKFLEETNLFNKTMFKAKTKGKFHGPCVFLNKNLCKIHNVKPIHCKVANCNQFGNELNEWFIVNYLLDTDDPVALREWASRLKSKPTIPGANPEELVPNERKLKRILNYKIIR
jgi:Fe-S-cluster containining protein